MRPITVSFTGSFPDVSLCPEENLPEFAFIGRSNVGKSSLINMLCSRAGIAKVSSTPGKTRLINYFLIHDSWYLVDLPGYGYAKISATTREKMKIMNRNYILKRQQLWNLFLLIDSRLPPQKNDLDFISWLGDNQIPFIILFTKTDKLSATELPKNLDRLQQKLALTWEELPMIIPTSAKTREGKEIILGIIEEMQDT